MELMNAHEQWKVRPDDERYPTVEKAHQAAKGYQQASVEKEASLGDLRAENHNRELVVFGKQGIRAKVSNWAFGQLATRAGAPAGYLRGLPATLAAQNINHGLASVKGTTEDSSEYMAKLLFHMAEGGSPILRAITSEKYMRIWNAEVTERLMDLGQEWVPAVPDIRADTSKSLDEQTALYVSDHDMFAFLRSPNVTIAEEGTDSPTYRGLIVWNSEVGSSVIGMARFLYREMCGNHIIWGASEYSDVELRHVGSVREKWGVFAAKSREYLNSSPQDEEAMIIRVKHSLIASDKEGVLDALFGKKMGLSRKVLEASYDAVDPDQDGDARTQWGMVQGITRYSQTLPHADERTKLDRLAGKILDFSF